MIPDLKLGDFFSWIFQYDLRSCLQLPIFAFAYLLVTISIETELEDVRQCVGKRRSRASQRVRSRPITLKPREVLFDGARRHSADFSEAP